MKIKKAIPHIFTSGNLLCGCLAIVKAFEGDLVWSAYLVGIAAVLDFFDGFVARALKVTGEFGKQLDSLADCVTFGVVPGIVMFHLIAVTTVSHAVQPGPDHLAVSKDYPFSIYSYIAFLIPVFSALRLAKFNLDTRQSDSFIGVPTPANSILICSVPLIFHQAGTSIQQIADVSLIPGWHVTIYPDQFSPAVIGSLVFSNPWVLIGLTVLMSFLLVAELPLFALKFKHFGWRGNEVRYAFLGLSLLMLVTLKFVALPLIILLYVLMSVISNMLARKSVS